MARCSGLLGQVMGWDTGCRLWDIGVSCVLCRVVVSWLADRQRRDTIPCLPRHACSRHPHQNPHAHSAHPSINQVNQSISPSVLHPVSRSRRIESYRVGGVACLHHAARRSLKSPPGGLAHLSLPHCCVAALLRCCCSCAVAVAFAWASGDGPELDEHAPSGRSLGVPKEDYSPILYLMNWLSGGEMTGNCCMRQEDKV